MRFVFFILYSMVVAGGYGLGSLKYEAFARGTDPQIILNRTWQWISTITPVEKIMVPDPEQYTIRLADDGKVLARFDCNRGGGSYEICAGRLSFGPLLSTRMACPPDSLDARFMKDLQRVSSFFIENNNLYLELPVDSGTMRFRSEADNRTLVPEGETMTLSTAPDPLEAVYLVEGRPIRLHQGKASQPVLPGAAIRVETRVFGHPHYGDLNGDGLKDAVLLLRHDPGGSGTFYYVAAALFDGFGWQGTSAMLLGDRIVFRGIEIRNGVITVNYLGRKPEEPLSAPATIGMCRTLTVKDLRIIPAP